LSVVYTYHSLKTIPIYGIFQGFDAHSLAALRIEAAREFKGNLTIRYYFGITLTPILSYVAYVYWRLIKLREHLIWFLTMFVFSFFILTYNLAKSPFALYILGFLFLNVLINGGIKKTTL